MNDFEFDSNTGCLYHPCGCLTSWFVLKEGRWEVKEWACDLPPKLSRQIVDAINIKFNEDESLSRLF